MDISPAFIKHGETTETVEQGEGTLDHPPMLPQTLAGVDPLAGDARPDVPFA